MQENAVQVYDSTEQVYSVGPTTLQAATCHLHHGV